jgi:aminoglycoside phosphotransferase (APT) family kinase protein
MRARWGPPKNQVALSRADLTALIQPAFPGQSVVASELTRGGLANTNVRLELSEHPEPILLRLYTGHTDAGVAAMPATAEKEATLHRLLAPKLPVPRLLFAAANSPIAGYPYMLRAWVDGERLEIVAHQLRPPALVQLAEDIGAVLAGVHGVTFPEQGFLDGALNVVPFPPGIGGPLVEFLTTLLGSQGTERLGPELTQALLPFAEREPEFGASWSSPPGLTHADFGGSNILVRVDDRGAHVAAVIDWEFAFSGSPITDLANLLRPPLGELPGFEEGVAHGYRVAGGMLPDDWRRRTLSDGLIDWAAFLGRPQISDALADDARRMIARTLVGLVGTTPW